MKPDEYQKCIFKPKSEIPKATSFGSLVAALLSCALLIGLFAATLRGQEDSPERLNALVRSMEANSRRWIARDGGSNVVSIFCPAEYSTDENLVLFSKS